MNAADDSIVRKYNQLTGLGLINVVVYPGGLFGGCYFKIFMVMILSQQQKRN